MFKIFRNLIRINSFTNIFSQFIVYRGRTSFRDVIFIGWITESVTHYDEGGGGEVVQRGKIRVTYFMKGSYCSNYRRSQSTVLRSNTFEILT